MPCTGHARGTDRGTRRPGPERKGSPQDGGGGDCEAGASQATFPSINFFPALKIRPISGFNVGLWALLHYTMQRLFTEDCVPGPVPGTQGYATLRIGTSPCIGGFENFTLLLSSGMFLGLSWGAEACRSLWECCQAGHVTESNRNPTA